MLAHDVASAPSQQLIENGTTPFPATFQRWLSAMRRGQYLRQGCGAYPVRAPLVAINVGYKLGGTANVVGEIPGLSAQFVVLAAHYDSWYSSAGR
ncbi:MAG: hypothetical protein M9927_01655 [Anaerolineae bacterium]|nr:hypothetical protein [Anaerolineae bacterium]